MRQGLVLFLIVATLAGCSNEDFIISSVVIVLLIGAPIIKSYKAQRRLDSLHKIEGFTINDEIASADGNCAIAIDRSKKKIAISAAHSPIIISFNDLLSVDLIENGTTVLKKSTSRTIGGFIGGEILFGPAGAIVGGLSGKTKVEEKVSVIGLKLIINNPSTPVHYIKLLDSEQKKDTYFYNRYKRKAELWHGKLTVIINDIDKTETTTKENKSGLALTSIADELLKLHTLKEKGIISEEEFQEQKKLLIGPPRNLIEANVENANSVNVETFDSNRVEEITKLNRLIQEATGIFGGGKRKELLGRLHEKVQNKNQGLELISHYQAICKKDLIDDLMKINSSLLSIRENVATFVEVGIVENKFPYKKIQG